MSLPAGIKLRQLEYFLAVAESLHFTNAAQSLYVTQPTLSHQIAELESRLGTPLLDRVGKRVRLTEAGKLFRAHASRALKELQAGGDALAELAGLARGELRVGIIQSFCVTLLPPILERFVRAYPNVRVRIDNIPARVIEEGLASGRLDLGIAFAPTTLEETEAEPIIEEKLLLVASTEHPLGARRSCAMHQLDGQRMALLNPEFSTRQIIDGYLVEAGARPDVVCETNTIEVLLAAIRSGELITILPERAVTPQRGIVALPLHDPTPVRVSALLWNRHTFRSQAARTFAEMVRQSFSGMQPVRRPHGSGPRRPTPRTVRRSS
jgi:LysR family cyn operon transcriptional activator